MASAAPSPVLARVVLRRLEMPLRFRFRTSMGEMSVKKLLLVELDAGEATGWGECVAEETPGYSPETLETAGHLLRDFLIPGLLQGSVPEPEAYLASVSRLRGHRMAKASIETALWDLDAKLRGESLARRLGAEREQVEVGVSLGIQPTVSGLLDLVGRHLAEGYRRIKLKIEPGRDVETIRAVRSEFPSAVLTADANAAYVLEQWRTLAELDELGLDYLEQPLGDEDLMDHAELARRIRTPICLDESIRSAADARAAITIGAARVFNVKVGRVGGLAEARRIHDLAADAGVPVWCGGMLEAGVGRAVNVHMAALPNFRKPGDTSSSSRYFDQDITEPRLEATRGLMSVPTGPGIGVAVRRDVVERFATASEEFTP